MYKLDVQKFKSLPSCKNVFGDGKGNYCAQGKLLAASGFKCSFQSTVFTPEGFNYLCKMVLWNNLTLPKVELINKIASLNNEGNFEAADALALELAITSGKFELVNCVKEQELVNA